MWLGATEQCVPQCRAGERTVEGEAAGKGWVGSSTLHVVMYKCSSDCPLMGLICDRGVSELGSY